MPSHKLIPDKSQFPIVLAVIKNQQKQTLLARRNDPTLPSAHNKWELIGGRIEWAETPEQALVREVKEETGLDVSVVRLLPKIYPNYWQQSDGTEFKVLLIAYECKVEGGELHTTDYDHKIGELKFFHFPEIPYNDLLPFDEEIIKLAYS